MSRPRESGGLQAAGSSPDAPRAAGPASAPAPGAVRRALRAVALLFTRLTPPFPDGAVTTAAPSGDGGAGVDPRAEAALLVPAGGGTSPAPGAPAGPSGEDVDDARIFPFVLLHRSRMHAVDLRRALDGFRGEDGTLVLRPGEVRTRPGYRLDVMVQVAVELVLGSGEVQEKLAAEPDFRRLVHDAVYYVSRRWADAKPLDMTDVTGRAAFAEYMHDRMDDTGKETGDESAPRLSEADLNFLYEQARAVARLLSERTGLGERFRREWRGYLDDDENRATFKLLSEVMGLEDAAEMVQQRRPAVDPPLYAEREPGRAGFYGWRCDRSGRSLLRPGVEAPDPDGDPEPDARFIRTVRRVLAELVHGGAAAGFGRIDFGTLASEFHVLSSSPAWSEVERAVDAFTGGGAIPAPERRVLGAQVRQFAGMLRERGEVLGLALLAGAAVGQAAAGGQEERQARGLRLLADGHRFDGKSPEELKATLLHVLVEELPRVMPGMPGMGVDPQIPRLADERSVNAWRRHLEERLAALRDLTPDRSAVERERPRSIRQRVSQYVAAGTRLEPRVEELLWAAPRENNPPVKLNLASMTLRDWSDLAYDALVAGASSDPWLGLAALAALGFRPSTGTQQGQQEGGWGKFVKWLRGVRLYPDPGQKPVDVEGLPTGPAASGAAAAVVVRRSASSLTDDWRPDPQIPALLLSSQQAKAVLQRLKGMELPPLQPALAVVAFEMPPEERKGDDTLVRMLNQRVPPGSGNRRIVYLYPDVPSELAKTPYVPAPRGLRDLLREPGPPVPA